MLEEKEPQTKRQTINLDVMLNTSAASFRVLDGYGSKGSLNNITDITDIQ